MKKMLLFSLFIYFLISFSFANIKDNNYLTKVKLISPQNITITSDTEFAHIYVIWDKPPKNWGLKTSSGIITCGKNGFLHEYIHLDNPEKKVTLITNEENNYLCDVYTFSENELPDWVQIWESSYLDADMLLFPTHADDELLYFGGILPTYAREKGYKVQVAYLTAHVTESYRYHELLNGLWTAGIKAYPIISDFPDMYADSLETAKKLYNEEDIINFQVEQIRRFKPEVVIGHDLNGEYGHGVHMLNAECLLKALSLTENFEKHQESAIKYGTYKVQKCYLHLFPENQIVIDTSVPLTNFNDKTALEIATEAFSKHKSQQKYFSVKASGKYDLRKFGLAYTNVGDDIDKDDLFENVSYPKEVIPAIKVPPVRDNLNLYIYLLILFTLWLVLRVSYNGKK